MDSLLVDSTALLAAQDTLIMAQAAVAAACDSVAQVAAAPITQDSIARLLHTIVENTAPDPTPRLGIQMYQWNFWVPIIALIAGLIGTYYGWKGYFFSKKTAENVARLSPDAQYALCRNFAVQLYKNLVRIMVLKYKVKHEKDITQDEKIALHLPKFEDVFFVEAYYKDADIFMVLQKMKVDFQAYEELITHLSKKETQEEADMQKLLAATGQLLSQTKDIAQLIRQTANFMETNSWTIKEAIGNAIIEYSNNMIDSSNRMRHILDAYKRGLPDFLFGGILFVIWHLLLFFGYGNGTIWKSILIRILPYIFIPLVLYEFTPPVLIYVLFRKNPLKMYMLKFKHHLLYKSMRVFMTATCGGCMMVLLLAFMEYAPVITSAIGNANMIEFILGMYVLCGIVGIPISRFIKETKEIAKYNKGNHLGQQLKHPANSVLDFFVMILVQYHSKNILDNKEHISSIQSSINEEYLSYTKGIEIVHVLSMLQSIQYAQNYPNPLYDKDILQFYHLPTQDIQEFMHWAEDIRFPKEYRSLIKKRTWTLEELETLFGYMLSVDTVLETTNESLN